MCLVQTPRGRGRIIEFPTGDEKIQGHSYFKCQQFVAVNWTYPLFRLHNKPAAHSPSVLNALFVPFVFAICYLF